MKDPNVQVISTRRTSVEALRPLIPNMLQKYSHKNSMAAAGKHRKPRPAALETGVFQREKADPRLVGRSLGDKAP